MARTLRILVLITGLLLLAACSSHSGDADTVTSAAVSAPVPATVPTAAVPAGTTAQPFTAGNQYVIIKPAAGQAEPTGPEVVLEVFSYGCPHCAEFAPYMDKLRAELPKGVTVRYMPAVFNASWIPYAQAYYAAVQLGVFKQTHDALFKAMLERYPLNSLQDLAAFYARHGVPEKKFLATAKNLESTRNMARDQRIQMRWGINDTPTLVVGRLASNTKGAPFVAQMRSADVTTYEQLQQLGLWMAQHVSGAH